MTLTLEKHGISLEDFELVHLGLSHLNNGVVIVLCVLNGKLVRGLLLVEDGCRNVLLFARIG